ncbi:MAG: hypothetical protein AB1634_13505 [Thermodesulfobacteriota bacterium]
MSDGASGTSRTLFGEIAVQRRMLTSQDLERGLAEQARLKAAGTEIFLGQILIQSGALTLREVSAILDIQKELLLGGIASPEALGTGKGREAVAAAHRAATRKRLLPWAAGGLAVAAAVALVLAGRQPAPPPAPAPAPAPVAGPSQPAAADPAALPALIKQLTAAGSSVASRTELWAELNRYPEEIVLPALASSWQATDPAGYRELVAIFQYLQGRAPARARQLLLDLFADPARQLLAYGSLFAAMPWLKDDASFWPAIDAGLASPDPFVQEKALQSLALAERPYDEELVARLKAIAWAPATPDAGAQALRALYARNKYTDFEYLLVAAASDNQKTAAEALSIIFHHRRAELFERLFAASRQDPGLYSLIAKSLRLYPHPGGQDFLLERLAKTQGAAWVDTVRALSAYPEPPVVKALAGLLDKTSGPDQAEVANALRTSTRQDFGFRAGAPAADNQAAVAAWQRYASELGEKVPPTAP